eukprot:SAG22_NODE_128_length_18787_cov_19.577108_14_plen_96_part_00
MQAIMGVVEQLEAMRCKSSGGNSEKPPAAQSSQTQDSTTAHLQSKIDDLLVLKRRIELNPELPLGIDMNKCATLQCPVTLHILNSATLGVLVAIR